MTTKPAVIVSGAASGIGRAVALRLHSDGIPVVGVDVDSAGLNDMAEEGSREVYTYYVDVSEARSVSDLFERVADRHPLRGLVNAAGIGGEPGDVTMTNIEYWQRVIDVNLTGTYLMSKHSIPLIAREGGGSVVHIASQLGMVGAEGSPAYSASKGAVIALARSMALDHAHQRIRVNAVVRARLTRRCSENRRDPPTWRDSPQT